MAARTIEERRYPIGRKLYLIVANFIEDKESRKLEYRIEEMRG